MTTYTKPSQQSSGHNHNECVSEALITAEHLCIERGVQLTHIRYKVLELIWESHKAVKAYELLDRLKPLQQAAKPATIYRALDFLIEQGLIHRVESLNAFVGAVARVINMCNYYSSANTVRKSRNVPPKR